MFIALVEEGDISPCDGVFLVGHNVKYDESSAIGVRRDHGSIVGSGCLIYQNIQQEGKDPHTFHVVAVGTESFNSRTTMALRGHMEDTPLQLKLYQISAALSSPMRQTFASMDITTGPSRSVKGFMKDIGASGCVPRFAAYPHRALKSFKTREPCGHALLTRKLRTSISMDSPLQTKLKVTIQVQPRLFDQPLADLDATRRVATQMIPSSREGMLAWNEMNPEAHWVGVD
ncbi:hypothetical protein NMY22_g1844 [Coprinellus aureogranulatus]|nr:hypothetical protein NMY22_g1844 [Coprinellus aureogranulatus]